jgi:uncharacterized protein YacL
MGLPIINKSDIVYQYQREVPMSTSESYPRVLANARALLRILIVLNWLAVAAILVLLVFMPNKEWLIQALKLTPSSNTDALVNGMRVLGAIGAVALSLQYLIFKPLLEIVETVRAGDPFVTPNARRLRTIAWTLVAVQVLGIVLGVLAADISSALHRPIDIRANFSFTGLLAVLLTFLLAQVFATGARMREELAGTV